MKKIITYSFLALLTLAGCTKNGTDITTLPKVPVPLITKDTTFDRSIPSANPLSFNGKFNVNVYDNTNPPVKYDILVRKTHGTDSAIIRLFKADVSTFPASFSVTGPQIAALFGTTIALGDNYEFGADIYAQDGSKYIAFPTNGQTGYGINYQNQVPGLTTSITYSVVCVYNPDNYQGNFVVVQDGWQDTNPGDIIPLTKIDATHFSFTYPSVVNMVASGIIVSVNPITNTASITKQTIGTSFNYPGSYLNPTIRSYQTPNIVSPCDNSMTFNLVWGYNGAEYGPYTLILRKQ